MVTTTNIERDYVIQGKVVDRATQRGVSGLVVQAWDRDTRYDDMLGQAVSAPDGTFTVGFTSKYFGDYAPDLAPDLYFKVSMDGKEVLNTYDKTQYNVPPGVTRVTLEIDLPQAPVAGTDRISAQQAFKAVDWWQASDFRGVFTQSRDKTMTVGNVALALLSDSFKNFDFAPVQPQAAREREIVNQTPDSARTALLQQQVEVTEVKTVSDLTPSDKVRMIAGYPLNLKAGDRVTLYEDNGVVQYYTRDPAPSVSADGATVARIDNDVQNMKARVAGMDDLRTEIANVKAANADVAARTADEAAQSQAHAAELAALQQKLDQVQQANASKDVQIAKLQSDLMQVTKAQDALAARIPLDRLAALELQLKQLAVPLKQAPVGTATVTVAVAKKSSVKKAPVKPTSKRKG